MFLKNGGWISMNNLESDKSRILTEITFSLARIDFCYKGFREGSSCI